MTEERYWQLTINEDERYFVINGISAFLYALLNPEEGGDCALLHTAVENIREDLPINLVDRVTRSLVAKMYEMYSPEEKERMDCMMLKMGLERDELP